MNYIYFNPLRPNKRNLNNAKGNVLHSNVHFNFFLCPKY